MAQRKQIALIYDYDVNWIGGTYYILNIIKALNFLPDIEKPQLTIYHDNSTSLKDLNEINYPYIAYVGFAYNLSRPFRKLNDLALFTIGRELVTVKLPKKKVGKFYYRPLVISAANIEKYYCWIPDLQDLYLPEFFKKRELKLRLVKYQRMVNEQMPIVFSSNAALDDFNKFFPQNKNLKKVLRFVSIATPDFNTLSIDGLRAKFNIRGKYFITSNQFWKHKNHMVVLEAFNEIVKKYPDIQLVLTGKEYDYRNSSYIHDLKDYVTTNGLTDKVLFLGFIDRDEQLKLMSESIAIIQPSLFEGWSTVVEDAKFLNKCIICSDLPVHREQLPESDLIFDPYNVNSLKEKIEQVLNGALFENAKYNHELAISEFARTFVNLF